MGHYWTLVENALLPLVWDSPEEFRQLLNDITDDKRNKQTLIYDEQDEQHK